MQDRGRSVKSIFLLHFAWQRVRHQVVTGVLRPFSVPISMATPDGNDGWIGELLILLDRHFARQTLYVTGDTIQVGCLT